MPDDLSDARLGPLRKRETALTSALADHAEVFSATAETLDRYHWALRVALDHRADGIAVGEPDLDLETAGDRCVRERAAVERDATEATRLLMAEIEGRVATGGFMVGDKVRSPRMDVELIVASIYSPEVDPALGEVTMTSDGGPVERIAHSWPLDANGRAIRDGETLVRYERWTGFGLRVAGEVHPQTRRIVT